VELSDARDRAGEDPFVHGRRQEVLELTLRIAFIRAHPIRLPDRGAEVYIAAVSDPQALAAALAQQLATLPFLTAEVPAITGRLKDSPEDFLVEELPAYSPSGEGEHLYLWIEKRGLNTPDAARALARALGTRFEEVGWAGLKDRQAVTRQWLSFHHAATPRAEDLSLEGVRVLSITRHVNKLRTGHLRGNRFQLRLTDVPAGHEQHAEQCLALLAQRGMPNFYGAQRFGHGGRNLNAAYDVIVGGARPPQKPFLRKLFMSALQAGLFNAWLGARMADGLFDRVLEGDVLRKEETGGLFISGEPELDQERSDRWEISATGPMFGSRMKAPTAKALALEESVLARWGVTPEQLARAAKYGEGTRRVARVRPDGAHVVRSDGDLELAFSLPKGSYATVLVEELTKTRGLRLSEDA
jgi:tRNA pseudouridine13 synthase